MRLPEVTLHIEVCFAMPERQRVCSTEVPAGTTLHEAIKASGILALEPEIDLSVCQVGVFGKLKTLDTVLRAHDRIEIYRPLIADPKTSRRRRAEKKATKAI